MDAKRKYYDLPIKNSENVFKTVRGIINKETKQVTKQSESNYVLELDNQIVSYPLLVPNSFNNFFATVVENMLHEIPPNQEVNNEYFNHKQNPNFRCPPLDEEEINKIFNSLKNKWSCGFDDVPTS